MIRALVAAAFPTVRAGLAAVLRAESGIEVLATRPVERHFSHWPRRCSPTSYWSSLRRRRTTWLPP